MGTKPFTGKKNVEVNREDFENNSKCLNLNRAWSWYDYKEHLELAANSGELKKMHISCRYVMEFDVTD